MREERPTVKEQTLASEALAIPRTTEGAFETAVGEYARLVRRIAFSVLRNHHDAEDATQETLMRLLGLRTRLERALLRRGRGYRNLDDLLLLAQRLGAAQTEFVGFRGAAWNAQS